MKQSKKRTHLSIVAIVGGGLTLALVLALAFGLREAYLVPAVVAGVLLFGVVWLWEHANAHADGSEWWQDDDASGWRGY